jgi:hypothetical protein
MSQAAEHAAQHAGHSHAVGDLSGHAGHAHAAGHPAAPVPYPVYYAPPPGRVSGFLTRLWARSPRWLAPLAILTCFAGAVGYVLVRDPTEAGAADMSTCLLKLTTGLDCPGCGGTRAFFYLIHGQLPAAARHHLLFVFAVPFLVYAYVAWAGGKVFGWRLPRLRLGPGALTGFLLVAAAFTVLRNLPWEPFTWFYV